MARKAEPPAFAEATCPCGNAVSSVMVGGTAVLIDRGKDDPDGDICGMKIGGKWVFTTADVTNVNAPTVRRRRHRCPATSQDDMRRKIDANEVEGPCVGYCGRDCPCGCRGRVPNRYGPNPDTMCRACTARRAARLGLHAE